MRIGWLARLVSIVVLAHFVCVSLAPFAFAQELVPDTAIEIELAATDPVLEGHGALRTFPWYVTFEGTLHVWVASSDFDPILRIASEDGRLLAEDDDSGGGTTAYVALEVRPNELHSITVAAKGGGAVGKLTVHVSESPETDATRAAAQLADECLVEVQRLRVAKSIDEARELLAKAVSELHAVEGARTSALVLRASSRLWFTAHAIEAFAIARDALVPYVAMGERTLPADHTALQAARVNLALTLFKLEDFPATRALQEQVLEVRLRTLPTDHPNLQWARQGLANTLYKLGDFPAARALQEQVLEVRSRTLSGDHPDLQGARHNLGNTLYTLGDLPAARALQEQVLEVRSRTLPDDHVDLNWARFNLALTLYSMGDFLAARALQEKVLEVRSRTLPDDHSDLQSARLILAETLRALGDLPAARALQEKALQVLSRTLASDHPQLQAARENLAYTLIGLGDVPAARVLLEKALEVRSRTLPDDHIDVQRARGVLAITLFRLGDLPTARSLQEQVLEVLSRTLPDDHHQLQIVRYNLAVTLHKLGDFSAARALQEKVLDVLSRTLPDDHPHLRGIRNLLAMTCARQGDVACLSRLLPQLARSLQTSLENSLATSTREAGERIARLTDPISTLLSFSDAAPGFEPTLFGLIETCRDRVIPCTGARTEADPELERLASESRELRGRIQDQVAASGSAEVGAAGRTEAISELVRQRDAVEAKLRQALVERGMVAPPIELAHVARALPEHSAAAGVRRYTRSWFDPEDPSKPETDQECLVGFVVSGSGTLRRVELGAVDEIAAAARRWRAAVGKPLERGISVEETPDDERAAGEALRALVLDPLLAAAGDVEALHICLDDALHLVPLDSLPMGDGLVGDRLRVHVESSFGRLIRHVKRTEGYSSLLAIGGVDFNADVAPRAAVADALAKPESSDRPGPLGTNLAPLAETRAEAANLGELFRNVFEREPVVLTGKKATKTALVDQAVEARFLHIATHGYFAPESVKSLADPQPGESLFQRMTLEETVTGLAPMALCGLALAGANRGVDALGRVPGIITAEEIAGLDLSSCELAVLSACETNVGITRAGQGLQSLQAALHAAGARTAITSLWKVDDEATRELFEDFYTRIWVKHEPKSEALWAAKMALRKAGRPTRDWAAWVLSGNPN